MYVDSTELIIQADWKLKNPETSAERVQELFEEWWSRKKGRVQIMDDMYVVPVEIVDFVGFGGVRTPRSGDLHFPKGKLAPAQIELLENDANLPESDKDKEADEFILWGAGRAAAIAAVPIPLADIGPLMANEGYMIYRLAGIYGYTIDKSVVAMLTGIAGGSIVGKVRASFLPFLKVPIAAGITYAVGKAAKAYFASGMTLSREDLVDIFTQARETAKNITHNI